MCRGGSPFRRSPIITRENSRAGIPRGGLFRAQPIGTNHIHPKAVRMMDGKVLCKLGMIYCGEMGLGLGSSDQT